MIFLDIDIPKYESMRTQENKVPNLIKYLRGNGTVENNNEFGMEERTFLSFTVNEKNLRKLLKVYARFQTLCMLPVFESNLKHKLYDSVLEYNKNTLKAMMKSIDNSFDKELKNNADTTFKPIRDITKFGYKVNPNVNDCVMMFLESFSFKTIPDSSDGFSVEMILWVCNDLTFYNGDEEEFLNTYYLEFNKKRVAFAEVDKKIDSYFLDEFKDKDFSLSFNNFLNDRELYNHNKSIEIEAEASEISIPVNFISQVEVRTMNNLHRIPIVGKTKGFIQHLGKGEMGITFKIILNQQNAMQNDLIKKIKALSLYEQENICITNSDFYLLKAMDVKELSLGTIILEEPSDDVDSTVITLLFTGASTNKRELDNNYFSRMERGDTRITLELFNNFLNKVLSYKGNVKINDLAIDNQNKIPSNSEYLKNIDNFLNMVISKDNRTEKDENKDIRDFTILTLIKSYRQELLCDFILSGKELNKNFVYTAGSGFFEGIMDSITESKIPKDSLFQDFVLYRFQRLSHLLLSTYAVNTDEEKVDSLNKILQLDNETQQKFLEEVYSPFIVDYFMASSFSDIKKLMKVCLSFVFKVEVMNNATIILKELVEMEEFKKLGNCSVIDEEDNFNPLIKSFISKAINKVITIMTDIISTDAFNIKVVDFINENFYKFVSEKDGFLNLSKKAIDVEINKVIEKIKTENSERNIFYASIITEIISKLNIMGCRVENKIKGYEREASDKVINRDFNFVLNVESKSYILSNCIMSIFLLDLFNERLVYGHLALESARNFVGPFVVSLTAIDSALSDISNEAMLTEEIFKYGEDIGFETEEKQQMLKFNDIYEKLIFFKKILGKTFGYEKLEDMKSLNKTFFKTSYLKKDFQKVHDITIFENFESPMSFLKMISYKMKNFKKFVRDSNNTLSKIDDKLMNEPLDEVLKEINLSNNEEIEKLKQEALSVFAPADAIADLTINKYHPAAIRPTTFLQTELLAEFKALRAIRNATRLVTYQYEKMMPDYEVFIIDEAKVRMSLDRGYDLPSKIYGLSNIISINITKDDASNMKFAKIKIVNTSPYFIGMNTYFEVLNSLNDENTKVVYNNKYITEKLVFQTGQIVNISLNQNSQFYDFTGKIDSVMVERDIITINCISFVSEIMGNSFDLKTSTATGLKRILKSLNLADLFRKKIKQEGKDTGYSKTNYLNGHLIPEKFIQGNMDNDFERVQAAPYCILAKSFDKSLQNLTHLDYPYNDLLSGKHLNETLTNSLGGLPKFSADTVESRVNEVTSHRIMENVNAVEFDLSFYGLETGKDMIEHLNVPKDQKFEERVIYRGLYSSFVKDDYTDIESEDKNNKNYISQKVFTSKKTGMMGYLYSYNVSDVKIYDVLNDVALRSPATYWDIIESGNYATLFFGRNNYMIARKNKTASLSYEDVREMNVVAYEMAKEFNVYDSYISKEEYSQILMNISELSAMYDQSLSKYPEINKHIQTLSKKIEMLNNEYFKKNFNADKELYQEEQPISNVILALSGYNLVSCSIKTNENYFNAVDIKYKPTLSDNFDRFYDFIKGDASKIRLKSFEGLPDSRVRVNAVNPTLTKDIHSEKQAFEYAQSVMHNDLINFYDGKIVILYQEDIKKGDEVLIIDSKNKLNGTVVVKSFQHIFDSDAGAITIITPGMKVSTSSLMSDIYMTGLVSRINYELLKSHSTEGYNSEDLSKVNQGAGTVLSKILREVADNNTNIPIAYNNVGFDYKLKKDKEITTPKVNINGEGKEQVIENSFYGDPIQIVSPRNKSSLPFKLYPLIQNGKPLIPDEDIYNSVERPFSFVTRLIAEIKYRWYSAFNFHEHYYNFNSTIDALYKYNFDLSDEAVQRRIILDYFPALNKAFTTSEDQFLKRLLSDTYYNLPYFQININPELINKDTVVTYNCKQLTKYEPERIKNIAKMLSQFTVVNLVELNGKVLSGNPEDNKVVGFDFEIVELIRKELEELTTTTVIKQNDKKRKWSICHQARLIDEPNKVTGYDDIGAVLINTDKETMKSIVEIKPNIKLYGEILDGVVKSASRNAINYVLKLNGSTKISFFLMHNFYGDSNFGDNAAANYAIRCKLLKQLIEKANTFKSDFNNTTIITGDFNLQLTNIPSAMNANTEVFTVPYLRKVYITTPTTTGNKSYDNFVVERGIVSKIDLVNVYNFNGSSELSDHLPIYLKFRKNYKIIN